MINRTGSVFVHRMQEETGAKPHEVARAYVLVRDIFGLNSLWAAIDALDNKVPASVQYDMLIEAGRLTLRTTLWFLRRRRERLPISQVLEIFRPGVAALTSKLDSLLNERDRIAMQNQQQHYVSAGVPEELARKVASLDALYAVLDIVEVATEFKKSADLVAAVYFSLVGKLELRWFASQINALPTDTHWQALARNAMRDDLAAQQRLLTTAVVKMSADRNDATQMLKTWEALVQLPMQRLHEMVNDLKSGPALDLAMLSVVLRELRSLA
jgi:glutamate dehydrogenase